MQGINMAEIFYHDSNLCKANPKLEMANNFFLPDMHTNTQYLSDSYSTWDWEMGELRRITSNLAKEQDTLLMT